MTQLATQPSSRSSTTASRRPPHGSGSTSATRGSAQVSVVRRGTAGPREWRSYRLRKAMGTAAVVAAMAGGSATSSAGAVRPVPYSAHSMVYTCCTPRELKERAFEGFRAAGRVAEACQNAMWLAFLYATYQANFSAAVVLVRVSSLTPG